MFYANERERRFVLRQIRFRWNTSSKRNERVKTDIRKLSFIDFSLTLCFIHSHFVCARIWHKKYLQKCNFNRKREREKWATRIYIFSEITSNLHSWTERRPKYTENNENWLSRVCCASLASACWWLRALFTAVLLYQPKAQTKKKRLKKFMEFLSVFALALLCFLSSSLSQIRELPG